MYKSKDNKGFTLIELLAAVVLLGLMITGAIFAISKSINKAKETYYVKQEELVKQAGREYFNDNRNMLPRKNNELSCVTLDTLVSNKYIDQIVDYKKKACTGEGNKVCAKKIDTSKYIYISELACGDSDGTGEISNYTTPRITFDPSTNITVPKNVSQTVKVTIDYPTNDDKNTYLSGYTYMIYQKETDSSEGVLIKKVTKEITGNNYKYELNIKLEETGTYYIKVNAYNEKGKEANGTSGTIKLQFELDCESNVKIVENGTENKWTNNNLLAKFKITGGIEKTTLEVYKNGTLYETRNYNTRGQITYASSDDGVYTFKVAASDKDGKSCTKTFTETYKIDRTAPNCYATTDKTGWTNTNVVLTASCYDDQSGCLQSSRNETFTDEQNTEYVFDAIYDNAGNKAYCNPVMIQIDKTKPECTLKAEGPKGNDNWFIGDADISFASKTDNFATEENIKYEISTSPTKPSINNNSLLPLNADTNSQKYYGYVVDEAGNDNRCEITVKRDATAPTLKLKSTRCTDSSTDAKCNSSATGTSITKEVNNSVQTATIDFKEWALHGLSSTYNVTDTNFEKVKYEYDTPPSMTTLGDVAGSNKGSKTLTSSSGKESVIESGMRQVRFTAYDKAGNNTSIIANVYISSKLDVKYTCPDGTGTGQTVSYGYGISGQTLLDKIFTKTGYTQSGWTYTAQSVTYPLKDNVTDNWIESNRANSPISLVCKWTPNTYKITLDKNSGTTGANPSEVTATYDSATISPAIITVPTKIYEYKGFTLGTTATGATVSSTNTVISEYTFNGWYTATSGGSKVIDKDPTLKYINNVSNYTSGGVWKKASNVTLYAQWTANTVTLPTITKTGYTCGWNTSSSGTTITYESGGNITPENNSSQDNMTLYGVCTANKYKITLDKGDGTADSNPTEVTATYDSATISPTSLTALPKREYTISGFTKGTNASDATISSTNTLTSKYTFNGWTATKNGTNYVIGSSATLAYSNLSGYTASGKWQRTSNTTLYANWTAVSVTLPTITKTGYTCGWSESSTATSPTYTSGQSITPNSNKTLYGICKVNTYTITLNQNNATTNSNPTEVKATYDSSVIDPGTITLPKREYKITYNLNSTGATADTTDQTFAYTFGGWTATKNGTNYVIGSSATLAYSNLSGYTASGKWQKASNTTLYAKWTGSGSVHQITKTGYTCGWATSSTATSPTYTSGQTITPTSNLDLYAVCTTNEYTITLNQNGATTNSSPTSLTATYNSSVIDPGAITLPKKEYKITYNLNSTGATADTTDQTFAYTFGGWTATKNGTNYVIGSSATLAYSNLSGYTASGKWQKASNTTLYAKWTGSGSVHQITKTGYACGWATSSTATSPTYTSGQSITPTSNLDLYAVCTANEYTITLNQNGATTNSSPTSLTATYNSSTINPASLTTLPKREYTVSFDKNGTGATATTTAKKSTYTFNGWYTGENSGSKVLPNTSALSYSNVTNYTASGKWQRASNTTLYANWTSASITLPTVTNTGYICGWDANKNASDFTYESGGSYTPNSNITLYAICKLNTVTITLDQNGATTNSNPTSLTATIGTSSVSPASLTTLPSQVYTVKIVGNGTNGSGATVTGDTTLTSTSTFGGWTSTENGSSVVIQSGKTIAYNNVSGYTSGGNWIKTTATTLYAKWAKQSVKLPTITRTGYTCGFSTSSTATSYDYTSGQTITPNSNLTLYKICTAGTNTITLNKNGGTKDANPTTVTATYDSATISPSTITLPENKYTVSFQKGSTATSATATLTSKTGTRTFKGWAATQDGVDYVIGSSATLTYSNLSGYTASGKWQRTSNTTLYAKWENVSVTLPKITLASNVCGWTEIQTGTEIMYESGSSYELPINQASITLYGVCTPTPSTITLNKNNGTKDSIPNTVSAVKNTTVLTPGDIDELPERNLKVSGFTAGTNASGATISSTNTITIPTTFNGWYTATSGGSKIINAVAGEDTYLFKFNTGTVSGYLTSGKWQRTDNITLYAQFGESSATLPTITKTGYTCGWSTSSTATTYAYNSGGTFTTSSSTPANTTLYGICTPKNVTVTFNAGSCTGSAQTQTFTYGVSNQSFSKSFSKTGYTFDGFSWTNGATDPDYTPTNGVSDAWINSHSPSATLYAVCNPKEIEVTFKPNGCDDTGAGDETQLFTYGVSNQKFGVTFSKAGYNLDGWAWSSTATTRDYTTTNAVSDTWINSNSPSATLYAVCKPKTYTITLSNDDATTNSSPTSLTATYNSSTISPSSITTPSRSYKISGFTLTPSASGATVKTSSGGSVSSTYSVTMVYSFQGWDIINSDWSRTKLLTNSASPTYQNVSGYTSNGKWNRLSGATVHDSWTSTSAKLPTITKTGASCGWSTNDTDESPEFDSGQTIYDDDLQARGYPTNMVLYGICSAYTYKLTLNQNGATTESNPKTLTVKSYSEEIKPAKLTSVPQRKFTVSGFYEGTNGGGVTVSSKNTLTATSTFDGWYTERYGGAKLLYTGATGVGSSGAVDDSGGTMVGNTTGNFVFANVPDWTENRAWIKAGGGTVYAHWTDKSVTLPTVTKTGYSCGWSTSNSATSIEYNSGATITPTSNMTMYSVCTTKKYSITLNQNGATTSSSPLYLTVSYNSSTIEPSSLTRVPVKSYKVEFDKNGTGATADTTTKTSTYIFNGWYTTASGGSKILPSTTALSFSNVSGYTSGGKWLKDGGTTLYAQWTSKSITLPTITKTGNTCGWSTSSTATTIGYGSNTPYTPTSNIKLYGICIPAKVNVTFNKNDGSASPATRSETYTYGVANQKLASNITLFTRSGYELLGWATSSSATETNYSVNANVTDNWILTNSPSKTLYAVWKKTEPTVEEGDAVNRKYCTLHNGGVTGSTNASGTTIATHGSSVKACTAQISSTKSNCCYSGTNCEYSSWTTHGTDTYANIKVTDVSWAKSGDNLKVTVNYTIFTGWVGTYTYGENRYVCLKKDSTKFVDSCTTSHVTIENINWGNSTYMGKGTTHNLSSTFTINNYASNKGNYSFKMWKSGYSNKCDTNVNTQIFSYQTGTILTIK